MAIRPAGRREEQGMMRVLSTEVQAGALRPERLQRFVEGFDARGCAFAWAPSMELRLYVVLAIG